MVTVPPLERHTDARRTPKTATPPPTSTADAGVDWDRARAFLHGRIVAAQLARVSEDEIQDLVQESLVRLLRATRTGDIRNLEGLMTKIAQRTAIDFIRRRRRWSLILERSDAPETPVADVEAPLGDPVTRVEFVVLEFFAASDSPCAGIAAEYFERRTWADVASRLGRTPAALRKQWSRCIEMLRDAARAGSPWFMEWEEWRNEA